ncbi:hypothetical protein, partial [Streptomyces sp. SID3343]|uniref:hypothetical protein n=1 Tax=Streptomyces sp. SID3343 TaxID=2690260 RepID=UPI001F24F44F
PGFSSKEPPTLSTTHRTVGVSSAGGVSLALTFGTLLSSQGTDASFGAESTAPSGRLLVHFYCFCFSVLPCCRLAVFRLFLFRVSSLAHRFGRFAFLAFGVHRVSAFSASRTLADLPTRFVSFAFRLEAFASSTSGSSSLADPFSRLRRLRLIVLTVSVARAARLAFGSLRTRASTLAGFPANAESLSEKAFPDYRMAAQIKPSENG